MNFETNESNTADELNNASLGATFQNLGLSKQQIEIDRGRHENWYVESQTSDGEPVFVFLAHQKSLSDESSFRFDHESRLFAESKCESFLPPLAFGFEDGLAYSTCRRPNGILLSNIDDRYSPLNAVSIAIDVTRALQSIHELGINYRRVVASKILIDDNRGILLGCEPSHFFSSSVLPLASAVEFAGYASPELAGAIDHDIGPASDLYSVGILLFRLLSGKLPFSAATPGEILFKHLTFDPAWEALPQNTPQPLLDILKVALQKDPPARYQNAESLAYDLELTRQMMLNPGQTESIVICTKEVKVAVCDPCFVGRREELANLDAELALAGESGLRKILVACPSGIGKSRLILEFLRSATKQNFKVLRGRGSNDASRQPMGPLLNVFKQLAELAAGDILLKKKLEAHLGHLGVDLMAVIPEFVKSIRPDLATNKTGPDEFGQNRVENAVAKLLAAISSESSPFIVWIDDCQWLDEQTLNILRLVAKLKPNHFLLLSSMRSESKEIVDSFVEAVAPDQQIQLGPLSDSEVRLLQQSMTGPLPEPALQTVIKYAAGSPFMASAVIRGLFESGAIRTGEDGWIVDQKKLRDTQTADDAAQLLLQRLRKLAPDTLRLLSIAAIAGKEFDAKSVFEISQIRELPNHLADARQKRLIWSKPSGSLCFVHDKIRESLISNLSGEDRKQIHLLYAKHLQQHRADRSFELAFHFHRSGRVDDALPYAIISASRAKDKFALPVAKENLRIARDGIASADDATKYQLFMLGSDVFMLDGQYDVSSEWLNAATGFSSTPIENAKILLQSGNLKFNRGEKEAAVADYEQALADLGQSKPKVLHLSLAKEILSQALHTMLPKKFVGTRSSEATDNCKLCWQLYSRLARGYWYTRDKYHTLWAHLRGMNQAERFAPTPELAMSYSEHAPAASLIPWHSRGIEYAERSLKLRQSFDDVWGQGQSRNFKSTLCYSASNFDVCIDEARQAVSILERTGDYWEVHIARYQLAAARFRQGDLQAAAREAQQTYYSALELGDFQSTANIIDVWIRANLNRLPDEVIQRESERTINDLQAQCQVLLTQGINHIGKQEFDAAVECFTDAIQKSKRSGIVNTYISPNYAWLATALRQQLSQQKIRSASLDRRSIARLKRAAKAAVRVGRKFKNELPHALRELGAAYGLCGQAAKARKYLNESVRVAEEQGAIYEQAQTLRLMSEFGEHFAWPGWEIQREKSQQAINDIEEPVRKAVDQSELSILDQFETLLDAGREISRLNDRQAVTEATQELAKRLLRCQRAYLVEIHSDQKATQLANVDWDLVQQAVNQSMTVTASEEILNQRADQRCKGSYLACPVLVDGQSIAVLYAANDSVQGLFGAGEKRIAEFLASVATSTFEKVESFSKLESMNLHLESLIQHRTAIVETRSNELENVATELRETQKCVEHSRDEAQAANQAKSEFLARMSHEIRTPISAVLGFTELMIRGVISDPDQQQEKLRTIHNSGKHLLSLVNDLLDLSKIESGQSEIERIPCRPLKIVQEVFTSLQSKALEKQIQMQVEIAGWVPETIITDPTRLCQVIINIVGNALKFTDNYGNVVVRLGLCDEDHANQYVPLADDEQSKLFIEVEDDGIGMSLQQLQRIFDPFTQADKSITRRFGGTGLGLSISKGFAEALGGGISVTSQAGVGSKFRIEIETGCLHGIEFIDQASIHVDSVCDDDDLESWTNVSLHGTRAMVVDDAETNREYLELILQDQGFELKMCEHGQQAVDHLKIDQEFDVILMDMQMPVLDGYAATEQIREMGIKIPIIALTANSMKDDDKRCIAAGSTGYLSKPIDTAKLLAMISELSEPALRISSAISGACHVATGKAQTPEYVNKQMDQNGDDKIEQQIAVLANKFVTKLKTRLPEFQTAYDNNDMRSLSGLGHWLKGTAGTVGLLDLARKGAELDLAGKEGSLEKANNVLNKIADHLAETVLA